MELSASQARVDFALSLVRKQTRIVEAVIENPPAHRAAEEVLALLQESLFLLMEVHKTLEGLPEGWEHAESGRHVARQV